MAKNRREVILDVQVDLGNANKRVIELTAALEVNKKQVAELRAEYKAQRKQLEANGASAEELARAELNYAAQLASLQNRRRELNGELRDARREMDLNTRATEAATGSSDQLKAKIALLRREYNALSQEERENTQRGRELTQQLSELTDELSQNEQAVGDFRRNVGNYQSALSGLTGGATELIQTFVGPGGLLAAGAAVGAGAVELGGYVVDITKQFRELRGEVQQLTGLKGEGLDEVTAQIQGLAQTFDKDFNEILIAGNATAKQFGITLPEALDGIRDGFLAGNDATGEYLDILREYPAQLKEVGISFDDANAIINQTVQDGIFSDKGIDAIKEAGLRLRELPDATKDALTGIGLDANGIQTALADGTQTVFDVIQDVSGKLNELPPQSAEVGTAIADIFGGPGEDAGLQFLQSLENVQTGLADTIDPTNDLVRAQIAQLEANEELARAQNDLSRTFSGLVGGTETFGTRLKTLGINVLLAFADAFKPVIDAGRELFSNIGEIVSQLGLFQGETGGVTSAIKFLVTNSIKPFLAGLRAILSAINFVIDGFRVLYDNSSLVRAAFDGISNAVRGTVQFFRAIPETLAGSLAAGQQIVNNFVEGISESFGGIADIIKGALSLDTDAISAGLDRTKAGIVAATADIGKGAGEAYAEAYNAAVESAPPPVVPSTTTTVSAVNTSTTNDSTDSSEVSAVITNEEVTRRAELREIDLTNLEQSTLKEIDLAQSVADQRTEIEKSVADSVIAEGARVAESQRFFTEQEIARQQAIKDARMASVDALGRAFSQASALFEEQTVASKAFAIAAATIDTYRAAALALASAPPPFGQILMATTIATGLAQVAKIAGVQFAEGGLVVGPGTGTSDSIPAMLSNGEAVINAKATAQYLPVLDAINRSTGGAPLLPGTFSQRFADGGIATAANIQAVNSGAEIRELTAAILSMPQPVVSVKEITKVASRVTVKEKTRGL